MDILKHYWLLSATSMIALLPWSLLFLGLRVFGVRMYHIRNREVCKRIQKRVKTRCSHTIDNDVGAGYAIGWWYAMLISSAHQYDSDIWMIATDHTYKTLTKNDIPDVFSLDVAQQQKSQDATAKTVDDVKDDDDQQYSIVIYTRLGTYANSYYSPRTVHLRRLTPLIHQEPVVSSIVSHYTSNNHTVAYLHGPTGTGKSVIGLLVARHLGANYCNTLRPWQPGDNLGELYADIEPSADKPLVVIFDEFDDAIVHIHEGVPAHKDIPIATPDKAGWNRMLDEIQWGMFPYLILLLTSNRPPEFITSLDPSYIRQGRVDLIHHVVQG